MLEAISMLVSLYYLEGVAAGVITPRKLCDGRPMESAGLMQAAICPHCPADWVGCIARVQQKCFAVVCGSAR